MPIFHFKSGDETVASATPLLFETQEDAINQTRLALCEMAPDQLSENAVDLITIEIQDEAKHPLFEGAPDYGSYSENHPISGLSSHPALQSVSLSMRRWMLVKWRGAANFLPVRYYTEPRNGFEVVGVHSTSKGKLMAEKTLDDLFLDTLKDIYYAEKQILKALPKMARAAQSEQGKAAFLQHRDETEGQIERLQQVFELIGKPARGKTCEAIQGILAEGEEIIEDYKGSVALDAGLISSAQAVEHYEIARYGTLKAWAEQLGHTDAIALIDANLQEEIATDEKLSALGEGSAKAKGKLRATK